jgi:23S rRNA-/tRNA-specific pseudouridylate synthase
MPVHVAGQYRKNTVLGVLSTERPELLPLLPVHRLDKPVSGVLLFARDAKSADILRLEIADKGAVRKIYVARVAGKFPSSSSSSTAEAPVTCGGDGAFGEEDTKRGGKGDIILVNVPLAFDTKLNHATAMPTFEEKEEAGGGAVHAAAEEVALPEEVKRKFETVVQTSHNTAIPIIEEEEEEEEGKEGDTQKKEDFNQKEEVEVEEKQESKRSKKRKLNSKNKRSKTERIAAMEASRATAATREPQARPAVTEFRLLSIAPDGLTSLVECRPLTGRSHQLRAHLAWLGHPIANDLQYGGKYDGPTSARLLAKDLGISWHDNPEAGAGVVTLATRNPKPKTIKDVTDGGGGGGMNTTICLDFECPTEYHDPYCPHCPFYGPKDFPTDVRPLWLHAHRYENMRTRTDGESEWVFEAPLPEWANTEWVPPVLNNTKQ